MTSCFCNKWLQCCVMMNTSVIIIMTYPYFYITLSKNPYINSCNFWFKESCKERSSRNILKRFSEWLLENIRKSDILKQTCSWKILVSLLLTLRIFHDSLCSVSVIEFQQLDVCWVIHKLSAFPFFIMSLWNW